MALQFPSSASIGQTYQSGSSLTYTYNGSVWVISSANIGISALNTYTASLKLALQTTGSNSTMLGNLNVQGTQTSLNQASLQITDKFIRVASGSLSSVQSDGAGIIIDGANVTMSWDSTNNRINFNTSISASSFYGDGSGLTGVTSYTNSDNLAYLNSKGVVSGSAQIIGILSPLNSFTSSINTTIKSKMDFDGVISGSSQLTSSFIQVSQTSSMTSGFATYAYQAAVVTTGTSTDSNLYPVFTINSGSNGYTILRNHVSGTFYFDGVTRKLYAESFVGSIEASNGVISGSSQLTASYDLRYTISGSVANVNTASLVTSINNLNTFTASQSTASLVTSITNLNTTTASLQSQLATIGGQSGSWGGGASLTSLNAFSASINTFTASHNNWSGTIDGRFSTLASYTASVNITTGSLNTFTSSINVWTSSIATTGSNSFNGAQVITGSLIVTTGSFIGSTIIANTSSLYLTSGSNLYVQNAGLVEISGSLKVSGSTIYTGSMSISSGSITMPNRPAFRVTGNASTERAAGLTLSGSAVTVDYNEGNYFNTTNGLFTAPIAGLYQVYYNGRVGGTNSAMQVIVYKNAGVALMWETAGNTGATHFGVSGIVKLAVNDTLKVTVTVGSIQFDGNDNFGAAYIG